MALTMAEKSVTSLLFKRLPFNLLQTFKLSTTQNPNSSSKTATTETSESSTKPKKKKPKNFFDVAKFLPRWGIGYHMAKKHWTNVTYEVTHINLYRSGNHGRAWGIAYVNGLPAPAPIRISGVNKRCWKYIKNPLKLEAPEPVESIPDPLKLESPKPDAPAPIRISGVNKRCWKYRKNPLKLDAPEPVESIPDPLKLESPKPDAPQEA